jgi:hypothetical protein
MTMPRRVLVVATTPLSDEAARERVREQAGEDAEVLVVAPASDVSPLQWLTGAEDDARADAAGRAQTIADSLPGDEIETRVGDVDPVTAIEDALRTFEADEIVVVTRPDDQAAWLEQGTGQAAFERFALPVTHLVVED